MYAELGTMNIDFTKYDLDKAKELARKFGAAAVTEMAFNLQKLDLVDRGNLLKSLKYSVRTKSGEVDRVQFSYEWYGRFHEVGASNIFGSGKDLPGKQWRSEAINAHMGMLNDEFAEFYASLIMDEIQIEETKMEM
jgi:hypothetical protein